MIRLIINIVLLVILAVFIALNGTFRTDVNIFGWKLEDISVVAVMIISLAVGVIYSFSFYLSNYFAKLSKQKLKEKSRSTKVKEKELKEREENLEFIEEEPAPMLEAEEPKKTRKKR